MSGEGAMPETPPLQEQGRAVISEERLALWREECTAPPAECTDEEDLQLAREAVILLDAYEENRKLREFAEYSLGQYSWGWNIPDGGSMQDKAEKLGIIVRVPASPEFRDDYDAETMYVCAWKVNPTGGQP